MTPRLQVCVTSDVLSRLQNVKDKGMGSLFGHFFDGTLVIMGFSINTTPNDVQSGEENSFRHVQPELLYKFPTEVDVCGVVTFGLKIEEEKLIDHFKEMVQDVDITDNPLLFICSENEVQAQIYVNEKLEKIKYTSQQTSSFVHVRMRSEIPICCEFTQAAVQDTFEEFRRKVAANIIAFRFLSLNVLLNGNDSGNGSGVSGSAPENKIKSLFDLGSNKKDSNMEVIEVNLLLKQTRDHGEDLAPVVAPVIHHTKRNFECVKMCLPIDGLSLVHQNTKVGDLYNILVSSFCRTIRLLEGSLLDQLKNGKKLSVPQLCHFYPSGCSHFVTMAYATDAKDDELKGERESMHRTLSLPLDQPLFRRSQAYTFPGDGPANGPLVNPHVGLKSGVKDGSPSLVKGLYGYHHYMQDRFDDNHWGCAYRSLQTIISWFRYQGYTEVNIPTHKQIQECLVKIGDKQSSFIGSRQWIGSTEVSFVLESMLGVSCRILTASTGEEVGTLGSELTYHFQTHGTPIMIGGGVLAHTIIGVDYNRTTGEIKFLILDPHYTGGEDLNVITGKGWVGWKDTKFWTKNAFYNLCLPLRPIGDV